MFVFLILINLRLLICRVSKFRFYTLTLYMCLYIDIISILWLNVPLTNLFDSTITQITDSCIFTVHVYISYLISPSYSRLKTSMANARRFVSEFLVSNRQHRWFSFTVDIDVHAALNNLILSCILGCFQYIKAMSAHPNDNAPLIADICSGVDITARIPPLEWQSALASSHDLRVVSSQ